MSIFSDNLRYLRESRKESQQQTADTLEIKRARYEPYESGKSEPPYEILRKIAQHYHISIDLLLTVDVRRYDLSALVQLDDNRILLPIKVDKNGRNLIEVVPHKARAGYLTGYADPEYIESLQQIALPFLGSGKYRAFPVAGDSMPPHDNRSIVIGRYVEHRDALKTGRTYVLVTSGEGITYKRLSVQNPGVLTVASDNPAYAPYDIPWAEVKEIWEYVAHIGQQDQKSIAAGHEVYDLFMDLKKDMDDLKRRLER